MKSFNQLVGILENSLENQSQFLVANHLTIADISIFSSLKSI
jgi:glutathione S-transferase